MFMANKRLLIIEDDFEVAEILLVPFPTVENCQCISIEVFGKFCLNRAQILLSQSVAASSVVLRKN